MKRLDESYIDNLGSKDYWSKFVRFAKKTNQLIINYLMVLLIGIIIGVFLTKYII